jgi:uncharacterized protein YbbC (DUF1343 family)
MLLGVDVLLLKKSHIIASAPFAVLSTHYMETSKGESVVDYFADSGLNIKFFIEPPFGFFFMDDQSHPKSYKNIPVLSLDSNELEKSLKNISNLIVDIQTLGIKNTMFSYTIIKLLELLNNKDINLYVLDRPDPVNASIVNGIIGQSAKFEFPLRYGMTLAEITTFLVREYFVSVKYNPVKMEGYIRDSFFDDYIKQPVNIYPGIFNFDSLYLYPGMHIVNSCNISTGGGLAVENKVIGAPWIDCDLLLDYIIYLGLEGFTVVTTEFTPAKGIYKGVKCRGIEFKVDNKHELNSIELFLEIIAICYNNFAEFEFLTNDNGDYLIDYLLSDERIRVAIEKCIPVANVYFKAMNTLEKYMILRKECLLY